MICRHGDPHYIYNLSRDIEISCPEVPIVHIKPRGHETVLCDSRSNRERVLAPFFVSSGDIHAETCKRCREMWSRVPS